MQEDEQVRLVALALAQVLQDVQQGRFGRSRVPADLGRAPDHLRPKLLRHHADLGVIGRDHQAVHAVRAARRLDGIGDQRLARQGADIFARDAL